MQAMWETDWPPMLQEWLDHNDAGLVRSRDHVLLCHACGCHEVGRAHKFKQQGYRPLHNHTMQLKVGYTAALCHCCELAGKSQAHREGIQSVKECVNSKAGKGTWLFIVEMPIEKDKQSPKRADMAMVHKKATSWQHVVALEMDPPGHFSNPQLTGRKRARSERAAPKRSQDCKRALAMDADDAKDDVYAQQDCHHLRFHEYLFEGMHADGSAFKSFLAEQLVPVMARATPK